MHGGRSCRGDGFFRIVTATTGIESLKCRNRNTVFERRRGVNDESKDESGVGVPLLEHFLFRRRRFVALAVSLLLGIVMTIRIQRI